MRRRHARVLWLLLVVFAFTAGAAAHAASMTKTVAAETMPCDGCDKDGAGATTGQLCVDFCVATGLLALLPEPPVWHAAAADQRNAPPRRIANDRRAPPDPHPPKTT